ncbi:hypothetical protein SAMN03159341_10580 [Paenibacillus sp. 1_12]|uniref:hypothetical protein n=1 Tax=Paenibacillus sp. 1_12 TaxID=1566278 RepID=UPI0008E971A1|nr:hypothetical protein [Paenibacillus sp. 1_12]SFL32251.1 hypothetical protein SAMN03159341_10580 [Paenibacillus sp. 1_12]
MVLEAGRIALIPDEARGLFLSLMKSVHPGMLLLFKSHMLLSEDAEEACGVDELPFDLGDIEEPILFGQDGIELSHCAEAYMDRLPSIREMTEWLQIARDRLSSYPELENGIESDWLSAMQAWVSQGSQIILLREDD